MPLANDPFALTSALTIRYSGLCSGALSDSGQRDSTAIHTLIRVIFLQTSPSGGGKINVLLKFGCKPILILSVGQNDGIEIHDCFYQAEVSMKSPIEEKWMLIACLLGWIGVAAVGFVAYFDLSFMKYFLGLNFLMLIYTMILIGSKLKARIRSEKNIEEKS